MKNRKSSFSLAKKVSLFMAVMIIFSTSVLGVFSYFIYRRDSIKLNSVKAEDFSQLVANSIDAEQFSQIMRSGEKTPYWYEVKEFLDRSRRETGAIYLYIVDCKYDSNVYYFAEGENDNDDPTIDLGDPESISYQGDELFTTIDTGKSTSTDIYSAAQYGSMVSGYSAIKNRDGAVVGAVAVDFSLEDVLAASNVFRAQITIIGLVFFVLTSAIALWYVSRFIGRPIRNITAASKKIAEGDMNIEVKSKSHDEIGDLFESFNEMAESTNRQIEILSALAGGDLTLSISPRGDKDEMSLTIQKMIDNLNTMFGEIKSGINQISTGSNQIAVGAQSLAQGATEQSASVEQLSTTIFDVASKAKDSAARAIKAASLAEAIKVNAEKSSTQMGSMMQAVSEINKASQSINKVIKIIDTIAFRTKILALNASVEAAHAGEYGKGFAVVAEEVRSLAAQSSEAASNTGALVNDSIAKAEIGAKMALETAQSLAGIVQDITESNRLSKEISSFSEEQRVAITQINTGIEQVAQVVHKNSSTAEESAFASEEMSMQADKLRIMASSFKLKDEVAIYDNDSKNSRVSPAKVRLPAADLQIILPNDGMEKY